MEDLHLLLYKSHGVFRGIVLDRKLADDILSSDSVRLFGKDYIEKEDFCEWFAVRSKDDGNFVGICFTDFYMSTSELVIRGLEAENAERSYEGWVVLLSKVENWEIQQWPYEPAFYIRTQCGEFCYLVLGAFAPGDQLPSNWMRVTSLDEIAEPMN